MGAAVGGLVPICALLEQYLLLLAERLTSVEERVVREIAESEQAADLFEEGAIQSARAMTDERKAYIASIVANGLSGDDQEQIDAKRLLKLLGEIDDDQVILLCKYLDRYCEDEEWVEKHEALIYGDPPSEDDDEATERRHWMRQLAIDQIERLGLVTLPTFAFYDHAPVIFRDGALVIGQPGRRRP